MGDIYCDSDSGSCSDPAIAKSYYNNHIVEIDTVNPFPNSERNPFREYHTPLQEFDYENHKESLESEMESFLVDQMNGSESVFGRAFGINPVNFKISLLNTTGISSKNLLNEFLQGLTKINNIFNESGLHYKHYFPKKVNNIFRAFYEQSESVNKLEVDLKIDVEYHKTGESKFLRTLEFVEAKYFWLREFPGKEYLRSKDLWDTFSKYYTLINLEVNLNIRDKISEQIYDNALTILTQRYDQEHGRVLSVEYFNHLTKLFYSSCHHFIPENVSGDYKSYNNLPEFVTHTKLLRRTQRVLFNDGEEGMPNKPPLPGVSVSNLLSSRTSLLDNLYDITQNLGILDKFVVVFFENVYNLASSNYFRQNDFVGSFRHVDGNFNIKPSTSYEGEFKAVYIKTADNDKKVLCSQRLLITENYQIHKSYSKHNDPKIKLDVQSVSKVQDKKESAHVINLLTNARIFNPNEHPKNFLDIPFCKDSPGNVYRINVNIGNRRAYYDFGCKLKELRKEKKVASMLKNTEYYRNPSMIEVLNDLQLNSSINEYTVFFGLECEDGDNNLNEILEKISCNKYKPLWVTDTSTRALSLCYPRYPERTESGNIKKKLVLAKVLLGNSQKIHSRDSKRELKDEFHSFWVQGKKFQKKDSSSERYNIFGVTSWDRILPLYLIDYNKQKF